MLLALLACGGSPETPPPAPEPAAPPPAPTHVGGAACTSCHADETSAWTGSHHDRAMELATADSVLGRFEGAVEHLGSSATLGPGHRVRLDGVDVDVRFTFGVDPLQQYLVDGPRGRLQVLPWSWDVSNARWFHITPDEPVPPGDPLHWQGPLQTWNGRCADCHSTNLQRGYDLATDTFTTTYTDVDVNCEACHGPGSNHVAAPQAGDLPVRDDVCLRCHSSRRPLTDSPDVTAPFHDDYVLAGISEPLYFPDGQARAEVFVGGSFAQSRHHAVGLTCTTCHDPHRAAVRTEGDGLCTSCHPAEHSRHTAEQASCTDCHMPARTYMVVDARKDHSFRIPRPDRGDSPDVCTGCHTDRDREWAASALRSWFGAPDPHWTELSALALKDDPRELLRPPTLDDPSPWQRARALATLDRRSPTEMGRARDALKDPSRQVRIAAARTLAEARRRLPPRYTFGSAFKPALAELVASEQLDLDQPQGHHNLGVLYQDLGDTDTAEGHYRAALDIDDTFVPALANLADLYRELARNEEAIELLERAATIAPTDPDVQLSLGLAYVRVDRRAESLKTLKRAVELDPDDPERVFVYAIALDGMDRRAEAVRILEQVDPPAPQITLLLQQWKAGR